MRAARSTILLALAGLLVAGCGETKDKAKGQAQPPAKTGQIIAHVGRDDITIHELNNEFRKLNIQADQASDDVVRRVLQELVTRKVLAQQAVMAGLDREPSVLLDVLRSREQVLSAAILQRDIQSKTATIGKGEIDRYINANPRMFAGRLAFSVEQISVTMTDAAREVAKSAGGATTVAEVARAFEAKSIPFTRGTSTLVSSEMPAELAKAIVDRKPDTVFFMQQGGMGVFFQVMKEEPRPLTGEAAAQVARQALIQKMAADEIASKTASAATDVKYEGKYGAIMDPGKKP